MKKFRHYALLLFAVMAVSACSKDNDETNSTPKVEIEKVELNQTALNLNVGEEKTLTATVTPSDANQTVTWESSNETIATVKDGTVTGKTAGTATITATAKDGGKTATCKVEVTGLKAYNVGDYYPDADDSSTAVGVVFQTTNGGVHGKVISLDETTTQWSTVNNYLIIDDYNDGAANTKIIMEQAEAATKYPATAWCVAKGTGWYLPAMGELEEFGRILRANVTTYNTKFTNAGGTAIGLAWEEDYYWTSNTDDSGGNSAISFYGGGGGMLTSGKDNCRVRACYVY